MPKTLFKFILFHFWSLFLLIIGIFIFLVVMADIIDQLDDFITYNLSLTDIVKYYSYVLPTVIVFLIPISVLLSTLRLFRMMSVSNGYTALIMGGIPLQMIMIPLYASTVALCFMTFVFNNQIGPETRFKKKVFQKTKLRLHRPVVKHVSVTGEDGLMYYINEYHKEDQTIIDLMITAYSPDGNLQKRIFAGKAVWQKDHWLGENVQIQPYDSRGLALSSDSFPYLKFGELINPAEILLSRKDPKFLRADQLKELSSQVPETRPRMKAELLLDYHRKFAVAMLPVIILLIAVPFGIAPVREASNKAIGVGVILCLVYYVVDALFFQLGKGLFLSPWLAAWSANFCFIIMGGVLLKKTPQ